MDKLIDLVLLWWEDHKYDTIGYGMDERNVYDEEPDFVKTAKGLREESLLQNTVQGMTKRDYFACHAMHGLIVSFSAHGHDAVTYKETISANAASISDALLKRLEP